MTINVNDAYLKQIAPGTTDTFNYDFYVAKQSDLLVFLNGTATVTTSITGLGNAGGGSFTVDSIPVNGVEVVASRALDIERKTGFTNNGDLTAALLNKEFDYINNLIEQSEVKNNRSIKYDDDVDLTAFNNELPQPLAKSSLRVNEDGTALEFVLDADNPLISSDVAAEVSAEEAAASAAEAAASAIEAADIAASIDLINDPSQAYKFDTISLMSSSSINFAVKKPLTVMGENGQYINFVVTAVNTGLALNGGNFAQRLTDYQGALVVDISDLSSITNNRDYVYGLGSEVFTAKDSTIRVNLLPDDDVSIFKGFGTILSLDIFGNEQVFNVRLANEGSKFTSKQMLSHKLFTVKDKGDVVPLTLGVVGDSVTDGADADAWVTNPTSGDNLSSTNYDHSANGGINSWFRVFGSWCNAFCGIPGDFFPTYNAAKTGRALYDGWAYRNFDYGFFQNAAYGNKAPDVCYMAMGINDGPIMNDIDVYADKFEQFIRKAWGYGSAVCLISLHSNYYWTAELEGAIKLRLGQDFNKVDVINIGAYLEKLASSENTYDLNTLYSDGGSLFDFTHPNNIGHRYLGASLAKEYFNDHIISGVGTITNLFSTSKAQVFDFPSYNRLLASAENGSFENKATIVKYEPSTSNVLIYVDVWIEPNQEVILKNFKAPIRTNASAGDLVSVYQNDPTSVPHLNNIQAVYFNDIYNGVRAHFLGELPPGLNRIQLTYDGLPTAIYPPEICINEGSNLQGVNVTVEQPIYMLATNVTAGGTFEKFIDGKGLRNASYSRIKHDQCYDLSALSPFPIEITIIVNDLSEKAGFILLDKNDKGIFLGLNNKVLGQWNVYTYDGNILTALTNKQFGQEPTYVTKLTIKTDDSNVFVFMSQDSFEPELIFTIPKTGDSFSGGKPINFGTFGSGAKSVSAICSVKTR